MKISRRAKAKVFAAIRAMGNLDEMAFNAVATLTYGQTEEEVRIFWKAVKDLPFRFGEPPHDVFELSYFGPVTPDKIGIDMPVYDAEGQLTDYMLVIDIDPATDGVEIRDFK